MPSKSKQLSQAEIGALEASRDIGAEILQSIKDMKAGKGRVVARGRSRNTESNCSSEVLALARTSHSLGTAQAEENAPSAPEVRS